MEKSGGMCKDNSALIFHLDRAILIYEAKIHVSLDSVTNVTKFYDQLLMLEKYSFHISYYVD